MLRSETFFNVKPLAVMLLLVVGGCAVDSANAPRARTVPGASAASYEFETQTHDDCYYGFYSTCHGNELTFEDDPYDIYTCPTGCHTYPLDDALRGEVIEAINRIDPSRCQWAVNYIQGMLNSGRIRYYPIPDGIDVADTHNSKPWNSDGRPDWQAEIHIERDYAEYSNVELARTLAHEAYHGFFNSDDQTAAIAQESFCVH
jgi:hypothetical protein